MSTHAWNTCYVYAYAATRTTVESGALLLNISLRDQGMSVNERAWSGGVSNRLETREGEEREDNDTRLMISNWRTFESRCLGRWLWVIYERRRQMPLPSLRGTCGGLVIVRPNALPRPRAAPSLPILPLIIDVPDNRALQKREEPQIWSL